MKYYLILPIVILALAAISVSCNKDEEPVPETEQPQKTEEDDTSGGNPPDGNNTPNEPGNNDVPDDPDNNDESEQNPMSNKLTIRIGAVSFSAILEDNAAAKAFKAMLPLIAPMSEMSGNEKYYYLPDNLPMAASNPGTIRVGDLMLYGSSCIVLFYDTFPTLYSYTRIGRVENPVGLASALGSGSVTVGFELR